METTITKVCNKLPELQIQAATMQEEKEEKLVKIVKDSKVEVDKV